MSFLDELKRRKVFRLAIAYVVVAWVIIQVVTAIEEPLNLPDWFDTTVIVLLAAGFPFAIMFSWAYDVTEDGIVRDSSGERAPAPLQIDYGKIALVAVLLLGAFLIGNMVSEQPDSAISGTMMPSGLQQFEIVEPPEFGVDNNESVRLIALTPDGRTLVFRGIQNGESKLFRRRIDDLDMEPIDGSEGTDWAFALSPDGESVVFSTLDDGYIKRLPISGGIPVPITKIRGRVYHLDWSESDMLVFSDQGFGGLLVVPASGGDAVEFSHPEEGTEHLHASFVPGTDWIVFATGDYGVNAYNTEPISFMSPEGEIKATSLVGTSPRVTPNGQLIYFNRNTLWSVDVDVANFEITGEPVPLAQNVYYGWLAHFSVSDTDSLVYRSNNFIGLQSLVWVDRQGGIEPTDLPSARYSFPRVSPDGDLVAVVEARPEGPDLWTHSLSRGERTQWTFEATRESMPLWSPDGRYLYFEGTPRNDTFRILIEGQGNIEQLTHTGREGYFPISITPDGETLIIDEWYGSVADGNNIGLLDSSGEGQFEYLMNSDFRESHAALSPDGTLLAYMSNQGGELEVYVRRFPLVGDERLRVSVSGDNWGPQWAADSRELFFWDQDDGLLYSVQIESEVKLAASPQTPLFSTEPFAFEGINNWDYDPTRDKFLMVMNPPPGTTSANVVLIQNWSQLLRRRSADN